MSKRKDELADLARVAPGPDRRRMILSEFGDELRASTSCDLDRLGELTLLALLGADTRLSPAPAAPDPEVE